MRPGGEGEETAESSFPVSPSRAIKEAFLIPPDNPYLLLSVTE